MIYGESTGSAQIVIFYSVALKGARCDCYWIEAKFRFWKSLEFLTEGPGHKSRASEEVAKVAQVEHQACPGTRSHTGPVLLFFFVDSVKGTVLSTPPVFIPSPSREVKLPPGHPWKCHLSMRPISTHYRSCIMYDKSGSFPFWRL
jgi:hypothetical protein